MQEFERVNTTRMAWRFIDKHGVPVLAFAME